MRSPIPVLGFCGALQAQEPVRTATPAHWENDPEVRQVDPPRCRFLETAREWFDHFGRPVHLGEFGSIRSAECEDRRYSKDVRIAAEARDIPWTLRDCKAMFACWNSETQRPLIREAFFDPCSRMPSRDPSSKPGSCGSRQGG